MLKFKGCVDRHLQVLNLHGNNIASVHVLAELDFSELKELVLSKTMVHAGNNKITRIDLIANARWSKLKLLNLAKNSFSRIDVVVTMPSKCLEELVLSTYPADAGHNNLDTF